MRGTSLSSGYSDKSRDRCKEKLDAEFSVRSGGVLGSHSAQVLVGTTLLLLMVPAQSIAQSFPTSTTQNQLSVRLQAYLPDQELPPIQPILPEVEEMRLVLRLGERRVYVYDGETVQASFPVAVGKPGWETPTGSFEVMNMLRDPGWTSPFDGTQIPPGVDNPLGERWIGFWTDGTNFIGFHGTPTRDSVGQAASHGCVRMYNEDIRQLFEMVSVGTPVIVEN